ncbi:hypothetical protein [Hydrogenophaga sp. PAMC20947]|uniref:hypothetical protein n=1 Tax=Hydrogenophaga sp. PAMC20947 TaxID=2565558 RepID=UPI00109DEBE2|nr:hypothetical protein [Hydrogenophaga sp. PAMC20947]QCB44972.1 hypothetical protein E5678_02330 [Hydrogenophaga sp. PAMC20947]
MKKFDPSMQGKHGPPQQQGAGSDVKPMDAGHKTAKALLKNRSEIWGKAAPAFMTRSLGSYRYRYRKSPKNDG